MDVDKDAMMRETFQVEQEEELQQHQHHHEDDDDHITIMVVMDELCNDGHGNNGGSHSDCSSTSTNSSPQIVNVEDRTRDLAWSFLSDYFFFVGGMCYVILATWDIIQEDGPQKIVGKRSYNTIEIVGPVVYLINSVIDVHWAKDLRNLKKKRLREQQQQQQQLCSPRPRRRKKSRRAKIRKFAAHRRGLFAAYSFGLAAFFGFVDIMIATYGNYDSTMIAGSDRGWWDFFSVHFYFLSAVFSVCGQRSRPPTCSWLDWINDQDELEDLGDLLFLLGSLFDCILCDLHYDDQFGSLFNMISSLLWLADACLYLRSDFCMQRYIGELIPEPSISSATQNLPAYIAWSG
jgi:hypothetical protein